MSAPGPQAEGGRRLGAAAGREGGKGGATRAAEASPRWPRPRAGRDLPVAAASLPPGRSARRVTSGEPFVGSSSRETFSRHRPGRADGRVSWERGLCRPKKKVGLGLLLPQRGLACLEERVRSIKQTLPWRVPRCRSRAGPACAATPGPGLASRGRGVGVGGAGADPQRVAAAAREVSCRNPASCRREGAPHDLVCNKFLG